MAAPPPANVGNLLAQAITFIEHTKILPRRDLFALASATRALRWDDRLWDRIGRLPRGGRERSSLMAAARNNDVERAKWLLQRAGVTSLAPDAGGATALHWSATGEDANAEVARMLLECDRAHMQKAATEGAAGEKPTPLTYVKDKGGSLALHWAASFGSPAIIRNLLEFAPETANARNNIGQTPLLVSREPMGRQNADGAFASFSSSEMAAMVLINGGSKMDAVDYQGKTVLHCAAADGHMALYSRVVSKHPTLVNAVNTFSQETPLLAAIGNGALQILSSPAVKATLGKRRARDGFAAIHIAAKMNMVEAIQRLAGVGVDPNLKTSAGSITPLTIAVCSGSADAIAALLALGADPNMVDSRGRAAIHHAASQDLKTLKAVLAGKPNVNPPTSQGPSPIFWALMRPENIRELAAAGADVNVVAEADVDAEALCLHVASYNGLLTSVEALCDCGSSLEQKSEEGRTALLSAAGAGKAEVVSFLLSRGADISAKDDNGLTAGELAMLAGHKETAAVLLEAHNVPLLLAACRGGYEDPALSMINSKTIKASGLSQALPIAVAKNLTGVVRRLLETGAAADTLQGPLNAPVLHAACEAGSLALLKLLLEFGANPNGRDAKGRTPLHVAVESSQHAVIPVLLKFKADVEAADSQGLRPLHLAVSNTTDRLTKAVLLLLRAGADVSALNHLGQSCVSMAVDLGRRLPHVAISFWIYRKAQDADLEPLLSTVLSSDDLSVWGVSAFELSNRRLIRECSTQGASTPSKQIVGLALTRMIERMTGPWEGYEEAQGADNAAQADDRRFFPAILPYHLVLRRALGIVNAEGQLLEVPEELRPALNLHVNKKPASVSDEEWRELRTVRLRHDAWERRGRLVCSFAASQRQKEPDQKKPKLEETGEGRGAGAK
jgi:ankyrin repeat protein